jgi:release factor glutamine methyltransferase
MKPVDPESLHRILAWSMGISDGKLDRLLAQGGGDAGWSGRATQALRRVLAGEDLFDVISDVELLGRTFRSDARACRIRRYVEAFVLEIRRDWAGRPCRVLEVGCGAGAIIISLALELEGELVGSDISLPALELARENAARLGARVDFILSDLFQDVPGTFDVIVSNLPHEIDDPASPLAEAAWEPPVSLFDSTGLWLGMFRRFLTEVPGRLNSGGRLYLEIPEQDQHRFAGGRILLPSGEVVGCRMDAEQARESLAHLGGPLQP